MLRDRLNSRLVKGLGVALEQLFQVVDRCGSQGRESVQIFLETMKELLKCYWLRTIEVTERRDKIFDAPYVLADQHKSGISYVGAHVF